MKKNFLTGLFALLICTVSFYSCSENEDELVKFGGKWNYNSPHINLDYTGNLAAEFNLGEMSNEQVIGMATGMAHEKMSSYFKGIEIESETLMNVTYVKDGVTSELALEYKMDDKTLTIPLAGIMEKFGVALPNGAPTQITFDYVETNDKLTVYLNTTTIKLYATMFTAMMQGNPQMEYITALVTSLLQKTKTVEVGFNLVKE
ncbi:MAG: hypothetical protein ACRDDZ_10365 [Marinifilaceae bacterium]